MLHGVPRIGYRNRLLQLERVSSRMPARSTVQVCEARDGQITIRYRDRALPWRDIAPGHEPLRTPPPVPPTIAPPRRRGPRASADHPWRQGFGEWRSGSTHVWQAIRD